MSKLFIPIRMGRYELSNRMVMAPMTRSRADDTTGVPGELTATYYGQRSGAGLIISEGVFPSVQGKGYVRTPGIATKQQVAGWKKVADEVHKKGGHIFMQLMHCGRISHPDLLPNGALPVAPSPIAPEGKAWTGRGQVDYLTPHELTQSEIANIVQEFRRAARNAMDAGMDGVELHAASGYLPEQFLSTNSNQRADTYGGGVEGRTRFTLEVLAAVTDEVGGDRVGIKISPEMGFNSISDANPQETYCYLVGQLKRLNLAYLHVALFGTNVDYHSMFKPLFNGAYLIGGGLTRESAEKILEENCADAVVFGGAFLANPDLPERFRRDSPLNMPDKDTFYTPGAKGYTDYPSLS